jgi:hypothetical protein
LSEHRIEVIAVIGIAGTAPTVIAGVAQEAIEAVIVTAAATGTADGAMRGITAIVIGPIDVIFATATITVQRLVILRDGVIPNGAFTRLIARAWG